MFGQAAMVLPEDEIKVGDSWDLSSRQNSAMGEFDRVHTYTYTGTEDDAQRFDLQTKLKPVKSEMEKKKADGQGMAQVAVPPELVEFKGEGKIVLDSETGVYKSSEMKNTLSSRQKYREKTLKTTVVTTIKMTIEKK